VSDGLSALKEAFKTVYAESGEPRICRAPGRVNLIGEHTDYNGLPVLPMTINREIRIAFAPRRDGLVRLHNMDAAYAPCGFENRADILHSAPGSWDNYCKAALQGLNGCLEVTDFPGMDLLVMGTIPPASGLSSSSAMVVASALAYLDCLGKPINGDLSRLDLAPLLARAERYVGTQGGGMDQAIILCGKAGRACKIDFFPLRIEEVPLPKACVVVLCDSMVKAEKTGAALHRYNEGPLSCRLIRAMVERQLERDLDEEVRLEHLGDLWSGWLCMTDEEVADLFDEVFPKPRTTIEEAAEFLGCTVGDIRERWLGDLAAPEDGFPLKARARHQVTERRRVEAARDALLAADSRALGELMLASHTSCAADYGISCPELDRLVEVALQCGALGARLTGAGFGGCTVNLVPAEILEGFCIGVTERYYDQYLGISAGVDIPRCVMPVEASPGAGPEGE